MISGREDTGDPRLCKLLVSVTQSEAFYSPTSSVHALQRRNSMRLKQRICVWPMGSEDLSRTGSPGAYVVSRICSNIYVRSKGAVIAIWWYALLCWHSALGGEMNISNNKLAVRMHVLQFLSPLQLISCVWGT